MGTGGDGGDAIETATGLVAPILPLATTHHNTHKYLSTKYPRIRQYLGNTFDSPCENISILS